MQLFQSISKGTDSNASAATLKSQSIASPKVGAPSPRIVIVGSGMSGLVTAMFMARRGFSVSVFEKRDSAPPSSPSLGRSMNLTLCERGLRVLGELGIRNRVLAHAVKLNGRAIHLANQKTSLHDYGSNEKEVLYAIRRFDLGSALVEEALKYSGIEIHYAHFCKSVDKENKVASFLNTKTNVEMDQHYDLLVGADGVFSEVRAQMDTISQNKVEERYSDWGYKELVIQPCETSSPEPLALDRLHVWSGSNILLIGIPNADKTITCNLFLPLAGKESFASLTTRNLAETFLVKHFPDLSLIASDLSSQFSKNPVSQMVSIQTKEWHYRDSIVLVGDASHGVLPFLGQGVNAAFEDCLILNQCLSSQSDDWGALLKNFEEIRRPDAKALSVLVDEHLMSLQKQMTTPFFKFEKGIYNLLARLTLNRILPIYSLISHTSVPYADIVRRQNFRKRAAVVARMCFIITPSVLLIYVGVHLLGFV